MFQRCLLIWMICLHLSTTALSQNSEDIQFEFEIPKAVTPFKTKGLIQLTLFHTHDMRGHAWAFSKSGQPPAGGLAALQSLVLPEMRRSQLFSDESVLLLDSGNFCLGTFQNDLLRGTPILNAMNTMGYHSASLGPVELSHGLGFLQDLQKQAKFPLLAANVFIDQGTTKIPIAQPYHILEQNGVRIGIIGLLTPHVSDQLRFLIPNLKIEDPIRVARTIENQLHAQVDILIALTSLGLRDNPQEPQKGQRDAITLAKASRYIKVIVSGPASTPQSSALEVNGTLVVQTQADTQYLGVLTLALDPKRHHRIVRYVDRVLPVNITSAQKTPQGIAYYPLWKHIPPDPTLDHLLKNFQNHFHNWQYYQVGISKVDVPHTPQHPSSPLGNFLADVLRTVTQSDIAWIPNNAIIDSGILPAGPITMDRLWALSPSSHLLITGKLSGYGLKKILRRLLTLSAQDPDFLQLSGIKIIPDTQGNPTYLVGDHPLETAHIYTVATLSAIATTPWLPLLQGTLQEHTVVNQTLSDLLADYFRHQRVLSQVDTQSRIGL